MREISWKPMATAPRDGTAFLVYVPSASSQLYTRGIHTMRWSGWGGGVWETNSGWRPLEHEMEGAVWSDLEVLAMSGKQASDDLREAGNR